MKGRRLPDRRPRHRAHGVHLTDQRQPRKAAQPNRFRNVVDVFLLNEELTQRMSGGRLDVRGVRNLGLLDLHRERDLAHPHPYHGELVTARAALPHPDGPPHPHQTARLPMEMGAVLPLVVALHVDLVAHLVQPGEPRPPVGGELTVRHLVGRPAPADQRADQTEGHHAAEQPIAAEAAHPGGVHRDDESDHTHHQGDRQHDRPHAALRRERRVDRRIHRDLAATGARRRDRLPRRHKRLRRHAFTLTSPVGATRRQMRSGSCVGGATACWAPIPFTQPRSHRHGGCSANGQPAPHRLGSSCRTRSALMALSVGTEISGYRIEAVLGSGGMGTVYRAAHPSLPRSDALKILSAELSATPDFRTRFIREADLAATLDHPNIVAVYNRGETDEGQLWIAMQYVQGSDADKEVSGRGMDPARAVHIIGEVAKALDYAHRRKLLHRDVKPANFLLAPNDERVLLADFGIARALDDATGLTATGVVMASVAYAAPESMAGLPVDHRADIYSLGCSLYRMLTGATPFAGSGGLTAIAAAHVSQPPPRLTDRNPALPAAIDDVIAKAMAKEPDQRYQSAGELGRAAADALDTDVTSPVRPQGLPTAPWSSRPPQPPPTQPAPAPPAQPQGPAWHDAGSYPSGHFSGPRSPGAGGGFPPAAPPGAPLQFTHPGAGAPVRRRSRGRIAAVIAALVLVIAAATVTTVLLTGNNDHPYQPQTFTHVHGTTTVTSAPRAVAALGPGDGDAVLSLGMQPVAIGAPNGALPSWEQQAVTGSPQILGFPDTATIAAAKPDVIIMTGDIDDPTYTKLAAIAPTITRPKESASAPWTWQDQVHWNARILGRDSEGADVSHGAPHGD